LFAEQEALMAATVVYVLCAVTSAACSILLFRMFWKHRRHASRLVLWSSLSFAGFAVSNALVLADFIVLRTPELAIARAATACVAGGVLLFGLISETE
jgi:uncharacterized membrane protein YbjE (DUF340 family)